MKRLALAVAMVFALTAPTQAQDAVPKFSEGSAAYVRGDYATALRVMAVHAALGNAKAQFNLGLLHYGGRGVPQDYAEAAKWYRLAAEQGHASAQFNLGFVYGNGKGVPQDYAEAVRWYSLAAEKGHASAQFNLGVMYREGEGVQQDDAEAVGWYRLAAEQGKADAQYNLGVMYSEGEGVPQDYGEAVKWYRLAAEQGHATAQSNLSIMYGTGKGVPKDFVQAHMWSNLAGAGGHEPAPKIRTLVAEQMTPADISKAQKLATEARARLDLVAKDLPKERMLPAKSKPFEGGPKSERELGIASARPRCVPEILCNPPKLDPQYQHEYTGLSGEDFAKLHVADKWGYIAGVWDSYVYRYYFEKDEEYNWLATCMRKYQGTEKINPVDVEPEIALGIKISGDKTRPASEFILAQIRVACTLGVLD